MQKSNQGSMIEFIFSEIILSFFRKQQFKDISDLMTKTDEKNGYQLGSIQAAINNINTRIADLRDLVKFHESN